MSVENKIRELLNQRLGEAFPGMGKNKEEAAPMQGSSEKPEMEVLEKGSKAASVKSSAPLAAGVGAKENEPMMQGSSQKATIDSEDDEDTQGKTQASKAKKQPEVKGQGAGDAPNFTTHADPTSVVSQASNAGNVHKEEVETEEEGDVISEEEFNALSDEEKAEYELVSEADAEEVIEAKKEEEEEEEEDSEEMKSKKEMMMKKMKEELAKDVENLFADQSDLSEEFKTKAASLFEAVVTARVAHEIEELQDVLAEEAAKNLITMHEELVNKIDSYLTYVAEQWIEQNAVAIEEGLRTEITEDFIAGLKVLFAEHYIEVPEEKYDVLGEMQAQIETLTAKVNEVVSESVELTAKLTEAKREIVFNKVTTDLAQTEVEKLRGLVEEVEFDSEELFEQKLSVIKSNYFPKSSVTSPIVEESSTQEVSGTVAKYAELLHKTRFGN